MRRRCSRRFLKDEQVFVDLVDSEDVRVAERPQIVVLLAPIPYDQVRFWLRMSQ